MIDPRPICSFVIVEQMDQDFGQTTRAERSGLQQVFGVKRNDTQSRPPSSGQRRRLNDHESNVAPRGSSVNQWDHNR